MTRLQRRINVIVALMASAAILAMLGGLVWLAMQVPWITLGVLALSAWLGLAGWLHRQIEASQIQQARRAAEFHLAAHERAQKATPPPAPQAPQERPRKRGPPAGSFPQPVRKPST